MALGPPPAVRDRPDVRHAIFDWRVPARIGTRPLTVAGRLEYVPPADDGPSSALIAVVVITGAGAAVGFGLLLLRLHRGEKASAEPVP